MSCVVRGCRNVWYQGSGVKFHSFPADPIRRNAWLSKLPIKGNFYASARICSEHFKPEDYNPKRPGLLLKNAVPYCTYKSCECCNMSDCMNEPSTSQSSSITDDLGNASPTQMEDSDDENENELPIKRRALNDDWDNIYMPRSHTTSEASNATGALPSPAQNIVTDDEPPVKQKLLEANLKSTREKTLAKKTKILQQQVKRQEHKIKDLESIINVLLNYISQSDIEIIWQGKFANICKSLKTPTSKKKKTFK